MRLNDLTGKRFDRWVVITQNKNKTKTAWLCKCDCGAEKTVSAHSLMKGTSKSCGCLRKEITSSRSITHGHTIGPRGSHKHSREYRAWQHAKGRCYNKTDDKFQNYGGRGIIMCKLWKNSFERFLKDMGKCPSKLTLERIDVNGNYEPHNCRWASLAEQSKNRTNNVFVIFNGERMILTDAASKAGVSYKALQRALKRGEKFEVAIARLKR